MSVTPQQQEQPLGQRVARALWEGVRLICPACHTGRIYASFAKRNDRCPHCNVVFERGAEGDFLVTTVAAYSITAVFIAIWVFILNYLFHDIPLVTQLWTIGIASVAFLVLFYRNIKGLAIGAIYLVFGLHTDLNVR